MGKQLVTHSFNIMKRKLLSQLDISQLHITTQTQEDPEEQLDVQPTTEQQQILKHYTPSTTGHSNLYEAKR